jgi:DNA-binding CsgD family transcriptional regulator
MNAAEPALSLRLRVLIHAANPARRDALLKLVRAAGYEPVETLQSADVVLCEETYPRQSEKPVLALGALDADYPGWLPGDASASQINAALAAVAAGLSVRIAEQAQAGFAAMEEPAAESLLTPREMEVLSAIADGLTNKMIARRLDISLHTVKFHVEAVFRKLGASTRTEAVARARERRLANTLNL